MVSYVRFTGHSILQTNNMEFFLSVLFSYVGFERVQINCIFIIYILSINDDLRFYIFFFSMKLSDINTQQAGAELCQAHIQLR